MSLSQLAVVVQGHRHGGEAEFTGVSTDTRTLSRGDLFVALTGPTFDGHAFLSEAVNAGAAGGLLGHRVKTALPYVETADTRQALGMLAGHWRRQFNLPVVAVTGSNGKTTAKEMIASILAFTGSGCVTHGNLNNDIGVPLTLTRLRTHDRYAVIEMGMNHPGEIAYLTGLAQPTVALITNAAEAHLAGLGSVEAVARAKGEIFSGLADDGVAVLNVDDAYCGLWRQLAAPRRVLTFGLDHPADVRAELVPVGDGCTMRLHTPVGDVELHLPLLGRHNVLNALAATACALVAGAGLADVKAGLERLTPVAGRLQPKPGLHGARVIDDSYNANPASAAAAIEVLREMPGERVLVLGDMGELGTDAPAMHRRIGNLARQSGIQRLLALGHLTPYAVEAFGKGATHHDSPEALVESLRAALHTDTTVLVKGSRMMRMDRVVAGLVSPATTRGGH